MRIFPAANIEVDQEKPRKIKHTVESTLRLITYSRSHLSDDLLNAYLNQTTRLKDLLSIKNAQMEAETEEEVEQYAKLLHKAMAFITKEILNNTGFTSEKQLFQLFRLISPDSHSRHPNRYRSQVVQIGRYFGPDPVKVPGLVSDLFYQMDQIANPIIRAIYFHHELIRIHPFVDGNGRTTRMAKNWMFMYELYPPIFISNPMEKKEYVETLEKSFLTLVEHPERWNQYLEAFFDQELNRLYTNAREVYHSVLKIGNNRAT